MTTDWYDNIEPGIRDLVRLMRDNGFNTTCSCEHEKYVEFEFGCAGALDDLYLLLFNQGYRAFKISSYIWMPPSGFAILRGTVELEVKLP